jgi:hypothetical protein
MKWTAKKTQNEKTAKAKLLSKAVLDEMLAQISGGLSLASFHPSAV